MYLLCLGDREFCSRPFARTLARAAVSAAPFFGGGMAVTAWGVSTCAGCQTRARGFLGCVHEGSRDFFSLSTSSGHSRGLSRARQWKLRSWEACDRRRGRFHANGSTKFPGVAAETDDKLWYTHRQKRDWQSQNVRGAMLIQPQTLLKLESGASVDKSRYSKPPSRGETVHRLRFAVVPVVNRPWLPGSPSGSLCTLPSLPHREQATP